MVRLSLDRLRARIEEIFCREVMMAARAPINAVSGAVGVRVGIFLAAVGTAIDFGRGDHQHHHAIKSG